MIQSDSFNEHAKAMTLKRDKLGEAFGSAGDSAMLEVGRCLAVFLGIAR